MDPLHLRNMGKASFKVFLIVCLLSSMLWTNSANRAYAEPASDKPGLIEDFESYADDDALRQAWTEAWSDKPGSVARALGHSSGSQGLELAAAIANSEWANIAYSIPSDKRDWSLFDGLSFWVDNTTNDNKNFSLNVALQTPAAKGEFGLKEGGTALTIAEDGSWQLAAFSGSSLLIPAGFQGVVRMAWDQFVQSAWQCDGVQADCAAVLDASEVAGLQFGYSPSGYVHNVITIDDIALYRADKVLEDFEAYADDAALQNVWRVDWESGQPSALRTIDRTNYADGGQAMKLSVSPPSGGPASDWANIKRTAFTGTDTDWSAFDGLVFWVNNASPSSKAMDLNLSLVTGAPKGEFSLKQGGAVAFYDAADGWKTTFLEGGSLSIAAGYKGMVRIPWSALSQSEWQGCDACDAPFDASKVLQIQFGFAPIQQLDNVLSIDRIGLYALSGRSSESGGGPTTEPVDHPGPPAWATAAGTHALEYRNAPADNPLKGFLPFYDASEEAYFTEGDDWRDRPSQLPYSLEFFYLPLSKLMNNLNDFSWTELDRRLEAVASRGNHAVFRVYLDYPNKPSGIPQFLLDEGLQTYEYTEYNNGKDATSLAPDYNDEKLMGALENFIQALGARYDGDPRVGFIMIGLIGFWGEWHTYPYDGNIQSPNLMPSDANLKRVLAAMDDAFDRTQLVLRYPMDNSVLKTKNFDVGYHDDSFAFQTLPPSLGGQGWHFWGRVNDAGVTEFWKKNSMGGEMRPEIQVKMWDNDPPIYNEPSTPIEGAQGEDYYTSLNLTHASWLIAQGIFQTPLAPVPLARAAEGSRRMGYEYYVPAAYLEASDGALKVGVELENRGVAPFYYDWKVELAAKSGEGIVSIWEPGWDLKGILPNTNGFDNNKLFESTDNPALSNGSYEIWMRYVNPLETVNADANKFRFANVEQNGDGWLRLGSVEVADSAAQAPVRVTGLTANSPNRLQLSPGSSAQIEVSVEPAEAGNKRVVWSSADSKVAYVSATGLVKAVGAGQTVITAKSSDGNLEKRFDVTVPAGAGSGSSSGGSSTAPATPVPEPQPELTDRGVKLGADAVTTVQSKNEDGVNVTTATLDAKKLRDAFRLLQNRSTDVSSDSPVILELNNDGGSVRVDVPSSALAEAMTELPDASITVRTDYGSYNVPVKVLGLTALAEKLGASLEEMTLSIRMNRVAGRTAELLSEQAEREGLKLLAPALDYGIAVQANGRSIELTDFGGAYLERTMILQGTWDPSTTTAFLFDPNAAAFRFVPSLLLSSGGNTEVVIKRNGNSLYVVASGSKAFADVRGHRAESDIELLASKRIINGVKPDEFSPDRPITRAEFAAMLVRSLGLNSPDAAAPYRDVADEDWFADAIARAADAGIVNGYPGGSFKPNERISREQMDAILSRALYYVSGSLDGEDAAGNSDTAADSAAYASRAEAVVAIKRFLQSVRFMN
ncbi:S-layer homology domain-containing protein [Cohnella hongkongensis]|uniref:S-layer homology domain-containing protein n=1 Tax=Cohnella hongkongensis TaxID=178337 RepID=A0ABV9F7H5_9BACL